MASATKGAKRRKRSVALATELVAEVVASLIRRGLVDPTGKSPEELREAVLAIWQQLPEPKVEFVADHRPALLRRAREFANIGETDLACLMYATWTEHWLNALLHTRCEMAGLSDQERKDVIRTTSTEAKLGWLPKLLGLPPIALAHQRAIRRVVEARNGFVHYKWQATDHDKEKETRAKRSKSMLAYRATVKYLQAYEHRHVYAGLSGRARRALVSRRADPT